MGKASAQAEPESNGVPFASKDEEAVSFCRFRQKPGRARTHTQASDQSTISSSPPDSHSQGWLVRVFGGIRRRKTISQQSASDPHSRNGQEKGAKVVGSVKDPNMVIPADIMFSVRRAQLYGTMMRLLVHNPYYLSRVISHVKYHECDALLSIVLDSVFRGPVHEPSLIVLFTKIIELEIERTTSIDTVMRNDAPSVHMLSAYLKNSSCLEYLQEAVGPTIETVVELGSASLESELGSVYQDWARTQESRRTAAAGYTEVQNLSRRRQRQLVHLTTHCLHNIINARPQVPVGLDVDDTKAYSLVGGIFFLRFVNAALASPNIYGLLDASPTGQIKTNLKLVARLMQRLSNYSAKPADEWPADARGFIEPNPAAEFVSVSPPSAASAQNGSKEQSPDFVRSAATASTVSAKSLPLHLACSFQTVVACKSQSPGETTLWSPSLPPRNPPLALPPELPTTSPPPLPSDDTTVDMGITNSGCAGSEAKLDLAPIESTVGFEKQICDGVALPRQDIALVPTGSTVTDSARTSGDGPAKPWPGNLPSIARQTNADHPQRASSEDRRSESGSSRTSPVHRKTARKSPEYKAPGYLEMYQDAWATDESKMARECLRDLGVAPPLVRQSNNHLTRIPLI
ncbi:Rho GTPase activation protein, partial [Linderina pennispora]